MLPSQVIEQASTFDLVVMDMAMSYERQVNQESQPGYVPEVEVDDLLKMRQGAGL
jgi:hypothetical protein